MAINLQITRDKIFYRLHNNLGIVNKDVVERK